MEYPKTENLYASNGEQNAARKTGPEFGFRQPEVGLIGSWLVLDKLDGMNMRVIFRDDDPEGVKVYGRTDKAQIPGDLMDSIRSWANPFAFVKCFMREDESCPTEVILFGEGIGPGIQGAAGKAYGGEKRFVLFDVVVDGHWLSWDNVTDIAGKLGIEHAPVLGRDVNLAAAEDRAIRAWITLPDGTRAPRPYIEGGILRTDPYVFDQRGRRVGAKYKVRDI